MPFLDVPLSLRLDHAEDLLRRELRFSDVHEFERHETFLRIYHEKKGKL